MNIQDIELFLDSFNEQANNVREQLTTLLVTVSDGKVPSVDVISVFNKDIDDLRTKYDGIYQAVQSMVGVDQILEEGKNVNTYVEMAKNSRIRVLREQMEQAKSILTKFISIKSKLDTYTQALRPYQDAAIELLSQISEDTIGEILPKTDASKIFLSAMEFENIGASDEGILLMDEIRQHYSWTVQMGLAAKQYWLEEGADNAGGSDSAVSTEEVHKETVEVMIPQQKDAMVIAANVHSEDISADEQADSDNEVADEESIDKIVSMESAQTIVTQKNTQDDITEFIDQFSMTTETFETDQHVLKVSNKIKRGVPSASSFRKEIIKMAKINKTVRTILPLLTNLGILTKEQCFLFGACMDCFDETDQNREHVNSAIETLAAKGYLFDFEYEEDGEKISAYCLSDYCSSCMKKESIATQMKGFWDLSFGNYQFLSDTEVERAFVINAIDSNALLLKYVYAMKEVLTEEEFVIVKKSIIWKDGYYEIAVLEKGTPIICHLVNSTENVNEILEESILVMDDQYSVESIHNNAIKHVFVLEQGTVNLLEKKKEEVSESKLLELSQEDLFHTPVENSESVEGVKETSAEQHENDLTISSDEDTEPENVTKAITPLDLLQKKEIPTDDEFYNVVLNILNQEVTTQDQLKSTIVNAALLAQGAGLEKNCTKSKLLSLQLCLATKVLIEESEYTSERLTTAFPNIDTQNAAMGLSAYLFAMLAPARAFDYGLLNQVDTLFKDYKLYFSDYEIFKPLFNKLMSVHNASATGFTPASIALIGNESESEKFLSEHRTEAQQYLTVPKPRTGIRSLPIFYNDCFGPGSDLYKSMEIITENKKDDGSLKSIKCILVKFCDLQNDTYSLSDTKIEKYLGKKWLEKNKYALEYDALGQAIRQFTVRLNIMIAWIEHTSKLKSSQKGLSCLRTLKKEIIDIILVLQKVSN